MSPHVLMEQPAWGARSSRARSVVLSLGLASLCPFPTPFAGAAG